MSYAESAIYPVRKRDRVLSFTDMALVWAGSAIVVNVWYSGSYLAPVGWVNGLLMIILGSALGSLIFAAAGVLGSDKGVPSMVSIRGSFGIRGSYMMSLLNYLTLIGWTAWMVYINASAADLISETVFGISGFPYWIIIGGAACTALAVLGAEGWKWFTRLSVTALVAIALAMNLAVFSGWGWDALASKPSAGMHPSVAFDLALIIPLSWAPLAADYMRFGRSTKGAFFGAFLGQGLVNAWFFATGLACALAFGITDPTLYVSEAGGPFFGALALCIVWLGTITTTFLDIYSANMSIINIFPRLKEWQGSLITGAAGTAMAFLPWLDAFVGFLYIIGAVFVPMFAIVLADYFLISRRDYDIGGLYDPGGPYWYWHGVNPSAIGSWLLGTASYFWIQWTYPELGATLPAFAFTLIFYLVLCRVKGQKKEEGLKHLKK
ncbi:MAG: cytosine permease [Candidatus Verstraetearchaeota archaeon]|nr:cytosine permease [Candidatus Verstraetearchaeota archaeon]